jgi:hypothetical protein
MILAPTLLLNAGSGAAIVRPTFSRDFAGEKTLNNGTGPSITFTRASDATYFDANGTLQTATSDTPRFDHDPATGASRGLLIEEARTNSIRNSQGGGAVAGTPGTLPTNWGASGTTVNGVAIDVAATGTEDGLAYVDLKFSGTPTASSSAFLTFDTGTQIVAANGQTWTGSAYVKLQGGALTNVTQVRTFTGGRTSAGASIAGQAQSTNFTPDSSALKLQRRTATLTMSDATVERAQNGVAFSYTNGSEIGGSADGFTLRIAAPQLEQGAFATSYIPTTTAAVTRSADSAVVTPISSFYNQSQGSVLTEHTQLAAITSGAADKFAWVSSFSDGSFDSVLGSYSQLTSTTSGLGARAKVVNENSVTIAEAGFSTALSAATVIKFTYGYATDDIATFRNGLVGETDTDADLGDLQPLDQMGIGCLHYAVTGEFLNGHIRRIAYFPKRLSNALLQSLTT